MNDVARLAGVSVATVSRVLNDREGKIRISEKTRKKVLEVCEQLNYVPNYAAQQLRSGQVAHTIGVYIPKGWGFSGFSSFTANLLEAVSHELQDSPYRVSLIFYESGRIQDHYEELRRVRAHYISGMLIVGAGSDDIAFLASVGANPAPPFILVHRESPVGRFVTSDNTEAGRSLVRYLVERGHRRIALITTPSADTLRRDYIYSARYDGFRQGLIEAGLDPDAAKIIYHSDSQLDVQRLATDLRALLTGPEMPTAIVSTRDSIAVYAVKAARSIGVAIPEDVSLVTFLDNVPLRELTDPVLTCVEIPISRMGAVAVRDLIRMIQGDTDFQSLTSTLQCNLIEGESCASR